MLDFRTFTDGDLREAIREAKDDEPESHVATLCADGNVVWYAEWCSVAELLERVADQEAIVDALEAQVAKKGRGASG